MDSIVILDFGASVSLSAEAEVEIFCDSRMRIDSLGGRRAYLHQLDSSGFAIATQETEVSGSRHSAKFKVKSTALSVMFFVNPGTTNCSLTEYAKYLVFKALKATVETIRSNYDSYSQEQRCIVLRILYETLWRGAFFDKDFRLGAGLLRDWLNGEGKRREPLVIENKYFNDKNIRDWREVWEDAARQRAQSEYKCEGVVAGEERALDRRQSGSEESSDRSVHYYKFFTEGSASATCSSEDQATFEFTIRVQAEDIVDFNERSAFNNTWPLCGERIEITIPDDWGLYLRGNCGVGQDYIIQGTETSFAFDASDFPPLHCEECSESDKCADFPPLLGEKWTYRVIGNGYVFSIMTEPVEEIINGYEVFRWRRSDNPPGLGEYVGCDPSIGLVLVAGDGWNALDPSEHYRYLVDPPEPVEPCPYGTPVGTVKQVIGGGGYENRTEIEVLSYEDVTVPYGTFIQSMKTKVTYYDEGQVDDNMVPTFDWEAPPIGLVKEIDVDPSEEIGVELIGYKSAGTSPGFQTPARKRGHLPFTLVHP
jgi:hypothetical protein